MTIAAGFVCSDGILLASDTLYSGAVQRTYGKKLWILHQDNPVVVFGGASHSVAALTRARDEIAHKIRAGMSLQKTLDTIDAALKKVDEKFRDPTHWGPDVQALVIIRAEGKLKLYETAPGKSALSPVDAATVCVGVDSLGDYFAQSLFRAGSSREWAKVVAAHLVWNCKQFASGYCGGDTHLIEVPATGAPKFIEDQAIIRELEEPFVGLEAALQLVLPREGDTEDVVRGRFEALTQTIQRLRDEARTHVPVRGMALQGLPAEVITQPVLPPEEDDPEVEEDPPPTKPSGHA